MAMIPGLKLPASSVFKLGSSWKGEGVCHLIKHSNNLKTKQDQPDLNSSALTPPFEKQPCFFFFKKNTQHFANRSGVREQLPVFPALLASQVLIQIT